MKSILLSAALVLTVLLIGCTNNNDSMMSGSGTPQVTVIPADGASGIALNGSISLTFAKQVDRTITERNLHLFSQKGMNDSSCPMGMMMMQQGMMDSSVMNHLIRYHDTRGHFQWNDKSTACSFIPDSMLMPNMSYMIHLGRDMVQMMQNRMGEMGTMSGHGSGMMSDDMVYHFRTMDTTNTGGGHNGHH